MALSVAYLHMVTKTADFIISHWKLGTLIIMFLYSMQYEAPDPNSCLSFFSTMVHQT